MLPKFNFLIEAAIQALWKVNVVEEGGQFASNRHLLFDCTAVQPQELVYLISDPDWNSDPQPRKVSQENAWELVKQYIEEATLEVRSFQDQEIDGQVLLGDSKEPCLYLKGAYYDLVVALTKPDQIKRVPGEDGKKKPVVFLRKGHFVAALMPLGFGEKA